jgi:hypothetical protein
MNHIGTSIHQELLKDYMKLINFNEHYTMVEFFEKITSNINILTTLEELITFNWEESEWFDKYTESLKENLQCFIKPYSETITEFQYVNLVKHHTPELFEREVYLKSLNNDELFRLIGNIKGALNNPSLRHDKEKIINKINQLVQINPQKEMLFKKELHNIRYCSDTDNMFFHKDLNDLIVNEYKDFSNYKDMIRKKRERHPRGILFSILRQLINTEGGFKHTRYIIDKYREEITNAKEITITEESFTYLINQLILFLNQQWTLKTVLERYKSKVRDFDRERLWEVVSDKGQKEKPLQLDLAKFLFDNGFSPFIEVTNDNERLDILVDYNGKHIVEVKVYDGNITKVNDGFKQINSYTTKHGQRVGYYIIFQINKKNKLDIPFNEIMVNDRLIYCFSIDIAGISGSNETRKSIEINQKYVENVLLETESD